LSSRRGAKLAGWEERGGLRLGAGTTLAGTECGRSMRGGSRPRGPAVKLTRSRSNPDLRSMAKPLTSLAMLGRLASAPSSASAARMRGRASERAPSGTDEPTPALPNNSWSVGSPLWGVPAPVSRSQVSYAAHETGEPRETLCPALLEKVIGELVVVADGHAVAHNASFAAAQLFFFAPLDSETRLPARPARVLWLDRHVAARGSWSCGFGLRSWSSLSRHLLAPACARVLPSFAYSYFDQRRGPASARSLSLSRES